MSIRSGFGTAVYPTGPPRSLTRQNPSPYYDARRIGYNASKAAVNMLTVQLAQELRDTAIVVNSVSPGYVKTDWLCRISERGGPVG
jgi:NAD(P)-dependent dehydrogenase (short-subunit alcohol dehydrogenase family)